jgi:hypothetical protein
MKFLGDSLFYVKNTKDLIRYNLKTHSSQLLGTTRDAVISLFVTSNRLREQDKEEEEKAGMFNNEFEIDEEGKTNSDAFTLCCIDESENIYVYKGKSGRKPSLISTSLKSFTNIPQELREKDLFGMGYPYYVSLYGPNIALSTDYGVIYLRFD